MDEPRKVFSVASDLDGSLPGVVRKAGAWVVDRLLGLHALQRFYEYAPESCTPDELVRWALDGLGIRVRVTDGDLKRFPASGPAVVVANHPFGGIEGMVLVRLLRWVRPDSRVLANYMLGRIPELREAFILVDPFDRPHSRRRNLSSMREALRFVESGGVLAQFPAGEVASLNLRRLRVVDPTWSPTVARIVRHGRCPVVPVFFCGRNSRLFLAAGLIHPRVRTAMLARELMKRRNSTIEVRIGSAIPYSRLAGFEDDGAMVRYLRDRTEILGNRAAAGVPAAGEPVQPRTTPRSARPIVDEVPCGLIEQELDGLSPEQLLVDGPEEQVWVARAAQIPRTLREIGRLREVTFRAVGEGTGREIDLDRFDEDYEHLFIWDRIRRHVVGAYRLGRTDELLSRKGLDGIYTSTLFQYRRKLFESMGPALEMGRSFIRPEHQRSYIPLMLLWKGIGRYVVRDPRYATLFGPVSISADYTSASQRLMVSFLKHNRYSHEWSRWVRPRRPFRQLPTREPKPSLANIKTLEDVSAFIADMETDQKGVPILLKQYLKLGGRLLGFNLDPDFGNVLDVLLMVDLRKTDERILGKYLGREGLASFHALHRGRDGEPGDEIRVG